PSTSAPPRNTSTASATTTGTPTNDGGGGEEPGEEPTEEPRLTGEGAVPSALLAFGLMTSGAVPVTLAVKRRMAGRHRRKR
ncbi:serine/threonine protein kinase, partial [Nonomuraea sp. NN258]|nr:serine/threonine protein kinase [Nonomuraea antri]